MLLITESPIQTESAFIEEAGSKNLYLEGVMSTAENVNRNGRKYPLGILEKEFDRYNEQHVKNGTAAGELNHPASSSINPRNTSHRITELHRDGNDFIGKAIVLENEAGNIVKSFVKGGLKVGVSTRALGTVTKTEGVNVINDDLNLICVDVVMNPSNQSSFVNGILESIEFVVEDSGIIVPHKVEQQIEQIKNDVLIAPANALEEVKLEAFRSFLSIITNESTDEYIITAKKGKKTVKKMSSVPKASVIKTATNILVSAYSIEKDKAATIASELINSIQKGKSVGIKNAETKVDVFFQKSGGMGSIVNSNETSDQLTSGNNTKTHFYK